MEGLCGGSGQEVQAEHLVERGSHTNPDFAHEEGDIMTRPEKGQPDPHLCTFPGPKPTPSIVLECLEERRLN